MEDFRIVDAHVHLYRDIEKEKQARNIPGRRDRDRWGNADTVIPYMDREGVSHIVVVNFYPTGVMRRVLLRKLPDGLSEDDAQSARQDIERQLADGMRRQNDWLCKLSQQQPRIVAGIGVQKLLTPEELVAEVELRAAAGARAVKILPGWFHEYPNDRAFWPMYQRCAELGLTVVSDTGTIGLGRHQAHPEEDNKICYGQPVHFTEVLQSFPDLTLVMAHFPSAFWDERLELARAFPNLMFDISGGFQGDGFAARDGHRAITESDAPRIMRKVGIERFMFGTDGPTVMIQPGLEQLLRLDLTDGEKQMILADNAHRIYKF
jgi:predicted TIM-barrel fold metal-dependent hydrolase